MITVHIIRLAMIVMVIATTFILKSQDMGIQFGIFIILCIFLTREKHIQQTIERFKPIAVILSIIMVIQTVTYGESLTEGFIHGIFSALRILNISGIFFLFIQTFSLFSIGKALSFLPYPLSFILTLSMGLITPVQNDYKRIHIAQLSRGWIPTWNPMSHIPILTPFIARILEKSQQLSIAIQSRGYTV